MRPQGEDPLVKGRYLDIACVKIKRCYVFGIVVSRGSEGSRSREMALASSVCASIDAENGALTHRRRHKSCMHSILKALSCVEWPEEANGVDQRWSPKNGNPR
jgi:hypothetical protein